MDLPAALGPALHKLVLTKHLVVVILYVILYVILHVKVSWSAEDTINNNVN